MAYTFADVSGQRIYCGAVTPASTFSFYVRFLLNQDMGGDGFNRWFMAINTAAADQYQLAVLCRAGTGNRLEFGFTYNGGAGSASTTWDTGWSAPVTAGLVGTYDGAHVLLYSGSGTTPKGDFPTTETPDQGGGQQLGLGCVYLDPPPMAFTAPITLYEAAWFPGVVLTPALAEYFCTGPGIPNFQTYADFGGIPLPESAWPLVANANDLRGAHNGTVTGATLVAGDGLNRYPIRIGAVPGTTVALPVQDPAVAGVLSTAKSGAEAWGVGLTGVAAAPMNINVPTPVAHAVALGLGETAAVGITNEPQTIRRILVVGMG